MEDMHSFSIPADHRGKRLQLLSSHGAWQISLRENDSIAYLGSHNIHHRRTTGDMVTKPLRGLNREVVVQPVSPFEDAIQKDRKRFVTLTNNLIDLSGIAKSMFSQFLSDRSLE